MDINLIKQISSRQIELVEWCLKNNFKSICVIIEQNSPFEIKVHFSYKNKMFSVIWYHNLYDFENGVWEIIEIGSRKDVLRSNNLDEFLKYIGVKDATNKNKQNN